MLCTTMIFMFACGGNDSKNNKKNNGNAEDTSVDSDSWNDEDSLDLDGDGYDSDASFGVLSDFNKINING